MNQITKISGVAPRVARRAVELFQDGRFKPRVIRNRKIYNRKGKHKGDQS